MRWQQKRDDIKERLHDMDEYEQHLTLFKNVVCDKSKVKSVSVYERMILDLEMDAHILGHEVGIPDDIVARDVVNALQCTNKRYLPESNKDVIQLRKKNKTTKSTKRICRCKK